MINVQERYLEIISRLKAGKRAIFKATESEMACFHSELETAIKDQNANAIEELFCILSNTQQKDLRFEESLLVYLSKPESLSTDQIIMALSVVRKHIIEAKQINGMRQDIKLLQILEKLLYSPEPEVVEWSLRLIEEMGSQAAYFKRHFVKIMPGLITFNKHKKNIKELVFILDNRFKNFPI